MFRGAAYATSCAAAVTLRGTRSKTSHKSRFRKPSGVLVATFLMLRQQYELMRSMSDEARVTRAALSHALVD